MITYPIHETFMTFQGEGSAMGLPAFFIRTFGCPVKCDFCDSAGTWHPSWVPKGVQRLTSGELTKMALVESARLVVVTGGEPAIHDLRPLVDMLQEEKIEVHLETSGGFAIQGDFDWIMLSPKRAKLPTAESVERADEFKCIIEKPEDITFYLRALCDLGMEGHLTNRPIWLHPEWSHRGDPVVLRAITEQVKAGKGLFRAGWQLHKLYNADALDLRARALVPLGGNPAKGY